MKPIFTDSELGKIGDVLGHSCSITTESQDEFYTTFRIVQYIRGRQYTTEYNVSSTHPAPKEFLAVGLITRHMQQVAQMYFKAF